MKAVFYEGAGGFAVGESDPIRPGPGEVRLDVAYCGVCGTDVHIARGSMDHRVRAPQVIGHEMSGTVAEVGDGVEGVAVGDAVVVRPLDPRAETPADRGLRHIARGLKFLGIDTPGAFQESWTVPAFTLHRLPDGVDLRLAALVEPLAVACHDARRGSLAAGETTVVVGGGPIGLLIGLVAHARGAHVILSEPNRFRRELASRFGFEAVDPRVEDLVARVLSATDDVGADVVFEVSGSPAGARVMTEVAALRGRVVVVAVFPEPQPVKLFDLFWKELSLIGARVYEEDDYEEAIRLLAGGSLPLADLVTSVEPLERLPEVFARLDGRPDAVKVLIDCQA